jgi:hypothetical protein
MLGSHDERTTRYCGLLAPLSIKFVVQIFNFRASGEESGSGVDSLRLPSSIFDGREGSTTMRTIQSVGVLSAAKIMGLIQGSLGLIFMPFFLLFAALGMAAGGKASVFGGVAGIVLAVFIPVLYAALGFITGAIGGLLYNLFAKWVGGIEVEVGAAPAVSVSYPQQTSI